MVDETRQASLEEGLKEALKSGLTNVDLNAVSLEEFAKALKSATFDLLKENVPDFERIVSELAKDHPDAWLIAEDPKKFYVVKPLTRMELKRLAKEAETDEDLVDLVIVTCTLYPALSLADVAQMKAGTVKNLIDTIMAISNFSGAMPVVKL